MDIQKAAALANIGSFFIGCAALYRMFSAPQQPPAASQQGVTMSPMMWLFLGALLVSGAFHAYAAFVHIRPHRDRSTLVASVTPDSVESTIPSSIEQKEHSAFNAQTILPDGRTVVNCTQDDLDTLFRDSTRDRFARAIGGKWVRLSGKIDDNLGDGQLYLQRTKSAFESTLFALKFREGWDAALAALPRGSTITFRGRVETPSHGVINIVECELL